MTAARAAPTPPSTGATGAAGATGTNRTAGAARTTGLPAALVQGIGVRVSVLGTRGKSTLAAMAAAALRRRGLAVHCNTPRANGVQDPAAPAWRRQASALGWSLGDRALVDEEAARLRTAWPVQALVLANRARSPDGMRRLHAQVCMPHYALVTNVRRDPTGLAMRPLPAEARRLVRSITPGAVVV